MTRDINILISNFDQCQLEIISCIAVRMAAGKAERWTGKVTFELNMNEGSVGDVHVNRAEVIRVQKKRRVRSSGL